MITFILEFFLLTCALFLYVYIAERKLNNIYRIIAGFIVVCTLLMIVCSTVIHLGAGCGHGQSKDCGKYGHFQKCGPRGGMHGCNMMMMCKDMGGEGHDCDKEGCDKEKCKKGKEGRKHKCIKKKVIVENEEGSDDSSDDVAEEEIEVVIEEE